MLQQLAFLRHEFAKRRGAAGSRAVLGQKSGKGKLHEAQLQRRHALIFHKFGFAQLHDFPLHRGASP